MVAQKKIVAATAVERVIALPEAHGHQRRSTHTHQRTESRAEIGALAVLQEHQNNDGNRSNDLHNDRDTHQHLHSCVFSVMVLILVVKKLSICLRLSAPCRSRKNPVP